MKLLIVDLVIFDIFLLLKKFVITSYIGNYKIKNFICKELFYIIFAFFCFFLLFFALQIIFLGLYVCHIIKIEGI
nr:MAG TPA: hypothetical protein [Caudoviricetes sp.]